LPNEIPRTYIALMLLTGMRRSEAAGLRWEDINFKAGTFRIPGTRTKNARPLALPMVDLVRDLLVARRAAGLESGGWVFPSPSGRGPGHLGNNLMHVFDEIEKTCGVRVSAHDLRRTFITIAESTDIPWAALKALVNHHMGSGITEGYVQMT